MCSIELYIVSNFSPILWFKLIIVHADNAARYFNAGFSAISPYTGCFIIINTRIWYLETTKENHISACPIPSSLRDTVYHVSVGFLFAGTHCISGTYRKQTIRIVWGISKSVSYEDNQIEYKAQNYLQMVNPWLRDRPLITRHPV